MTRRTTPSKSNGRRSGSWLLMMIALVIGVPAAILAEIAIHSSQLTQHQNQRAVVSEAASPVRFPANVSVRNSAGPVPRPAGPSGFFPGWWVSQDAGYMVQSDGSGGRLLTTQDGGKSWTTAIPLTYGHTFQRDMSFPDQTHGFVVSVSPEGQRLVPHLWASYAPAKWQQRVLPASEAVDGIDFIDGSTGFVLFNSIDGPRVYSTSDGGQSWMLVAQKNGFVAQDHLEGMRFLNARTGWIGGWRPVGATQGSAASPLLYMTEDGGQTWHVQILPVAFSAASSVQSSRQRVSYIDPPHFYNDREGVAAATIGSKQEARITTYRTHDGGHSWQTAQVLPQGAEAWSSAQPDVTWTGAGSQVQLARGASEATSSVPVSNLPEQRRLLAVQFVDASVGVAQGYSDQTKDVRTYRTTDGGRSWTRIL